MSRDPAPVVLIAYHYPPGTEVGGLRAAKVATALTAAGHPVTVVRAGRTEARTTRDDERLAIHDVVPAAAPREWYGALRARLRRQRGPGSDAQGEEAPWVPPAKVADWKRWLLSGFWLPDDKQGFIWPAARAAVAALERYGPRAILYSTSPPHSAQLAGLFAHLTTRATWVVELRDPWTDNPGKPWYCRSAATDALERRLEAIVLRKAALVVGVSQGICDLIAPRRDGAVILVRNGIDALTPGEPLGGSQPLRVLHAGTCYLGRDPRPFLRALAEVARRRGIGPGQLDVEFLGQCEWFDGVSMRGIADDLGLGRLVRFTAWLPVEEATRRIDAADRLLLLAEGQPLQVPNKLYDYLGTRRPILAFADRGGETARMLEAVGGHTVTQSDATDLAAAVERALFEPRAKRSNVSLLESWTSARQMARLVRVIDGLRPPGPHRRERTSS